MKTIAKKRYNALISQDFMSLEEGYYSVEVKRIRSLEQHRKFFALVKVYMEASGRFKTVEECLQVLKICLGYSHTVEYKGQKYIVPDSISFESMDQDKFNVFFDRAVELFAADLGVSKETFLNELE